MKIRAILFLLCLLTSSHSFRLTGQVLPAYPNTQDVITCFPDTTGYSRITVGPIGRDYDDLQDAIDAAPLGSVLILDAGAVFNGGFILPDKVGSSRVDLQACKLEYSIVSPK